MRKLIAKLMLVSIFLTVFAGPAYARDKCVDQADDCYERCDENWSGNTTWDGAGRVACKTGCALTEAACVVKSWFE